MFKRVCLLTAFSVITFGVVAKPISVPTPVAQQLPVELIESQQEIAISVPQTASAVGMQFGLVGALIGSAVQNSQAKKAEERVVPLRNLLVDYRFNQKMQDALRAKLASEGLSPEPALTVMATPWEAHDAAQAAKLPPHAMVLTPYYGVDSNFSELTVRLTAQIVNRTVKPNGKIKTVIQFNRAYAFQFPLQGVRNADPVQDWVAFGSAGIAQLLDQGIAQTTDMLVQDFSAEGRAAWGTKPAKGQSVSVEGITYTGIPVRQGTGWAWVRIGKDWMQSVQGYQPLKAGALPVAQAPTPVVAAAAETPVAVPAQAQPLAVPEPAVPAVDATPAVAPVAAPVVAPVAAPAGG